MNNFAEQTKKTNEAVAMLRKACAESSDGKEKWRIAQAGIGEYMASLRRRRRLTVAKVARLMGVSGPFLTMLEMGRRDWTEIQIERWDYAMEELRAQWERLNDNSETKDDYI